MTGYYLVLLVGLVTGALARLLATDLLVAWRNHRRVRAWKRSRLSVTRRNRWR